MQCETEFRTVSGTTENATQQASDCTQARALIAALKSPPVGKADDRWTSSAEGPVVVTKQMLGFMKRTCERGVAKDGSL